jgi:N-acetylmuramoyl-L-alanine amidase
LNAVFRRGDSGPAVAQIIGLLERIGVLGDAVSGEAESGRKSSGIGIPIRADQPVYDEQVDLAVRAFQQQRGLSVDGVVGPLTFRRLDEARWRLGDRILTHLPGSLMAGDDVYTLQSRLLDLGFRVGRVDGYFGPVTEGAVRDFQRNFGIPPDGTCGPATLKALARLSPMVKGGAPNALRAQERIREAGPHLGGKTVVIDVGRDSGLPSDHAATSDAILHDLAQRVEGRLVAIGVQAFLTTPRWAQSPGEEGDRAAFANRTGADLFVSLALDASDTPDACGVSTYFFGDTDRQTWSSAGERFAGLVQREIVARSDLVDLRSHPKTWEVLRHTRMPAVRLDAGYLTNPGDNARLRDPEFRDVLAEAIVVSVQRFYLSPELDPHTGVLRVSELRESFQGA